MEFYVPNNKRGFSKRALDGKDSEAFSGVFKHLASFEFFCS